MKILLYVLFIVFCFVTDNGLSAEAGEICRTPYNYIGYCIPLLQCASLLKLVHTANKNPNHRAHLRISRCDNLKSDTKNVHACCPMFDLETLSSYDGCDAVDNTSRFYRTATFIDQYPWTVRLMYQDVLNGTQSICSGALINNEYVLTAAHCVHDAMLTRRGVQLKSVVLGEFDISKSLDCLGDDGFCADPTLDVAVASVHIHDNYTGLAYATDDIALVRLKRRIPRYTDFVRPICITDDIYAETYRPPVYITNGWGYPEKGSRTNKLTAGKVKDATTHCVQVYQKEQQITVDPMRQLCAGGKYRFDTCYGNGGSPLMQLDDTLKKWFLLGIASFGPDNCHSIGFPAVYTRVREYHFWIMQTIFKLAL